MRRRFGIIITIVLAIVVLIVINSLAYVTEDPKQDSELNPNRSTYHGGPTGTRALYDLLNESGYRVMRWREPIEKLLGSGSDQVKTFVIIGNTRLTVEQEEADSLLFWVSLGGRLVIIDRHPQATLLPASGPWTVRTQYLEYPDLTADPANPEKMTEGMKPLKPMLPTLLTRDVESVMPSRFLAAIKIGADNKQTDKQQAVTVVAEEDDDEEFQPPPAIVQQTAESAPPVSPAPVTHLTAGNAALLVDYPYGAGRIAVLSDPYMVANGGVKLNDNLTLAINLLGTSGGITAFDELHQGHGVTQNAFAGYFAGTPVLAICGQIALLIIMVLWTRGRRFGRPLPLPHVDRRSSLEFVASMAELQHRARAYDLAIENVYSRTRRVLARYAGMEYNSPRSEIARRVAMRSTLDQDQLETLMRQSEEAINGGLISERQSVHLVKRLREIEGALGLRMRSREIKQTAQNI